MVLMMSTDAIIAISVSIRTHEEESKQPRVASTPTANVPKMKLRNGRREVDLSQQALLQSGWSSPP